MKRRKLPPGPSDLWARVRAPFLMQQSIHRCRPEDWELYDVDGAGCTLCGRIHRCAPGTCKLADNNGHQVCELTGYCVKGIVFAEEEYVTTVACMPTAYVAVRRCVEREQVMHWVWQALGSPAAQQALEAEARKRGARAQAIFTRLARHYKATNAAVNLVEMCAVVARAMGGCRVPRRLPEAELEALCAQCGEVLVHFCHRFLECLDGLLPQVKMQGFVVGMLYLMRTGVRLHDSVVVLPCLPVLRHCLPLESQLHGLLRLSTKIVTECENTIKATLRGCSRQQLVERGFQEA